MKNVETKLLETGRREQVCLGTYYEIEFIGPNVVFKFDRLSDLNSWLKFKVISSALIRFNNIAGRKKSRILVDCSTNFLQLALSIYFEQAAFQNSFFNKISFTREILNLDPVVVEW